MKKMITPGFRDNDLKGRKILFANFPADGHFNPLTGLAVYLKNEGADVRWYSSETYRHKLNKMQVPHYPFRKAVDVQGNNFDEAFPGRKEKKSQIGKLKFDIIHAFILRGPEYYADIVDIYREFPFELMVADCAFTGIPFVKELMSIPVVSIGVLPLTETSVDLPPGGLGMIPSSSLFGKLRQDILRWVSNAVIFREPNKVMHLLFDKYKIPHRKESLFDMMISKSDLLLQSGTPGFEYYRSDMSSNIHFIGALLPVTSGEARSGWFDKRLNQYQRVFLVTQGTVEKDVEKLLVPVLEAFKDSSNLVVCTTGGSRTKELRERFPQDNLIIEDFIPFSDVMPYTDVYITNGGYGGVMLGIENNLPLVVAGLHEGKNEINARVEYFKLGVNLRTEKPKPQQIIKAVEEVIDDPEYRNNAEKLAKEFRSYQPDHLFGWYLRGLLPERAKVVEMEERISSIQNATKSYA
jgi:UDP:flavonoid glycosyltransferase YjiC (YdhE family)